MIQLNAQLICDRCNKTVRDMLDVEDIEDARKRLTDTDWGCDSENGDDVCAECWQKWDAEHSAKDPA